MRTTCTAQSHNMGTGCLFGNSAVTACCVNWQANDRTGMMEATRQALGGPHSRVRDEKSACASVDRGIGAMGHPDGALRQAREGELLVYGLEVSVGPWLVWASGQEHCESL